MTQEQKSLIELLAHNTELGVDAQPNKKKQFPHRIKYRGKYIRTHSGKTVWPSKGAAKSALNLELSRQLWKYLRFRYEGHNMYLPIITATQEKLPLCTPDEREEMESLYELEVMKDIEIVPVSADEFYQKKS